MSQWTVMELDGLLERETLPDGFTFSTVYPGDLVYNLPDVRIGLGWFVDNGRSLMKGSLVPHSTGTQLQLANTAISAVTDMYLPAVAESPDDWGLSIIARKGYVTDVEDRGLNNVRSFTDLDESKVGDMLAEHGFPVLAFLVNSGVVKDADLWLDALKQVKQADPDVDMRDVSKLIRMGVEADDLESVINLPLAVVEGIYS
jgi:hypothetical protein